MLPISGIPASLNSFADQFADVFNHPAQLEHFKEMLAGLLISENKTVAGIHQRIIDADGYDALRRFMSRNNWSADKLTEARLGWVKDQLPKNTGSPTVIAIDPTFVHHTGENIYGVYWYWNYAKRAYVLAQRVVLSTWVSPSTQVPLTARLYHRGFLEEQRLYLEEKKPAADASEDAWEEYNSLVAAYEENEKNHVKQWQLVQEIVDECEEHGFPKEAYVLDAALLTPELAERIEKHGQAWVSRLAKNRLVQVRGSQCESLLSFAKSLPKNSFKAVQVKTRHGEIRTYWCFSKCIYVKGWQKVRVVISYDNAKLDGEPIFIVTNKKNWTQPGKIVQLYTYRDPIEHSIRDEKQELGLEGSQMRSEQAVRKHWELSFVAHTFLELGFNPEPPPGMPSKDIETIGQKSRLFELEVLQDFVARVQHWVLEGWDTKELIESIMLRRLNRLAA